MRTTVPVSDELLIATERLAREGGQTLGDVIDTALRRELAVTAPRERPAVPTFRGGTGARPEIDLASNSALREALDEDLDPDRLR